MDKTPCCVGFYPLHELIIITNFNASKLVSLILQCPVEQFRKIILCPGLEGICECAQLIKETWAYIRQVSQVRSTDLG